MSGNVEEWVNDRYVYDYYGVSLYRNPQGPFGGDGKVVRGSSWDDSRRFVSVAFRDDMLVDIVGNGSNHRGIRCARDAE